MKVRTPDKEGTGGLYITLTAGERGDRSPGFGVANPDHGRALQVGRCRGGQPGSDDRLDRVIFDRLVSELSDRAVATKQVDNVHRDNVPTHEYREVRDCRE